MTNIITFSRSEAGKMIPAVRIELFRMAFAILMLLQMAMFMARNFISEDIIRPVIHYPFLSFFPTPSGDGMKFLFFLMALSLIFMLIRKFLTIASVLFFLTFTLFWLADKSYFNNHYYFISILALLLLVYSRINQQVSWKNRSATKMDLLMFRTMIFILFFWAGLNKLTYWWLVMHQPVEFILTYKASFTGNEFWNSDFLIGFLIYGGAFFDLLIIPALWWRKTRVPAIIAMILFNIINYWIFHDVGEIGIFPLLNIALLIFFLPDEWLAKFRKTMDAKSKKDVVRPELKPALYYSLMGFLILQMLLPARHHLVPGHVDWTSEGQRFAWRMKIMYKDFEYHFFMHDGVSGEKLEVNMGGMLTPKQYTNLGYYPDLIPPTAAFLQQEAIKRGLQAPYITADFQVGFNGLPRQPLFSPDLHLNEVEWNCWSHNEWLAPLKRE